MHWVLTKKKNCGIYPVLAQLVDQIKQFLAKTDDWEELETLIPGVLW